MDSIFLNTERLKTEKRRLEYFIGFLVLASILALGMLIFQDEVLRNTFQYRYTYPSIILSTWILILVFVGNRKWLVRLQKKGRMLPTSYFWYAISIEILFPSIYLIVIAHLEETSTFLDSPIIFVYFILIIVSSMHLNFWISASMGLIMALFLSVYTYWVTATYPTEFNLPISTYYVRSFIYFFSGICAGLVANELRTRINSTYKNLTEKEQIEGLFRQQVSRELVDVLKEKGDYTARQEATIMFIDIRDFTEKVQLWSPEEVNAFQNKFFAPIIQIINDSHGIVNQIMGDGLMATFGVPATDNSHFTSAWTAAKNILVFQEEFRRENEEHQLIDIGIGMHCGEVLIGNIGTETRKQLSVSGTPVILASRIEQMNKELGSTLLMSLELFDLLSDQIEKYHSKKKYKMKGIDLEIEIIRII